MRKNYFAAVVSFLITLVCAAPFIYVLLSSFKDVDGGMTFQYYYQVFLGKSSYLFRFWKSLGLCFLIAAGQVIVSVLAGFGFAKCEFKGKNVMFFALMLLMVMPLQVTLVPNYLILEQMGLLNTCYALILPAFFVPLGTFIMTQSFKAVSDEIIEAARLDGCTTLGVIIKIVSPMNVSGLVCTMLLSFLDAWNMVEQPLTYLQDFADYPLAAALAFAPPGDDSVQLACCILVALPPVFLFSYYKQELVEGIEIGGEK